MCVGEVSGMIVVNAMDGCVCRDLGLGVGHDIRIRCVRVPGMGAQEKMSE